MSQDAENTAEIEGQTPHFETERAAAIAILRSIRDAEASTTAEKINAIKSISALLGRDDIGDRGPGMMSREEIARELERLRVLTQG